MRYGTFTEIRFFVIQYFVTALTEELQHAAVSSNCGFC